MAELTGVRRALVVGLGRSGVAASRALRRAGIDVIATDRDPTVPGAHEVAALEVEVVPEERAPTLVADVDLVVPSPGVPPDHPVTAQAAAHGTLVWSEPELAWHLYPGRTLIGITGTNGKTTVTGVVAEMLATSGIGAVACGNIGLPVCDAAATTPASTVLVAELSSFQLAYCTDLHPTVAALTNLAPDHLDWHGDLERYAAAKARLWQRQGPDDWLVWDDDDVGARRLATPPGQGARTAARPRQGWGVWYGRGALDAELPAHRGTLLSLAELPDPTPVLVRNLAMAAAVALLAGAQAEAVVEVARRCRPGPHRQQLVAEHAGVRFVDDSKATNPHAAAAALRSYPAVRWIAGGLAKGVDLRVLIPALGSVRHAYLIGTAAAELSEVCSAAGVPHRRCADLAEAVAQAAADAGPGEVVLLSPACASMDQFRDYADRGEQFARLVRTLLGTVAGRGGGPDG